jgi:YidC/Oxa1 family membrane protein insertase
MLDYIRFALYGLLVLFIFILFQQWQVEHPKNSTTEQPQPSQTLSSNYIPPIVTPTMEKTAVGVSPVKAQIPLAEGGFIRVETDVLSVNISKRGGNIIQLNLLKYPQALHSSQPVTLMNTQTKTRYLAQSGLLSPIGPDTTMGQAVYEADQPDYKLENGQQILQVKLHWQNKDGLKITKIYNFKRDSYEIGLTYQINNQSNSAWTGNLYLQLLRSNEPPVNSNSSGLVSLATYFGAAISSPEKPFEKISFKQMESKPLNQTITGGWAAMIQHYFVSAWVPEHNITSQYFSHVTADGLYAVGMVNSSLNVKPSQTVETHAKFYAGPASSEKLEKVAPGLPLTIDYGWLWFISVIIFWMMQKIYNVVGNWGWSIVLVTLVIKLMFYHLSAKSYRSMSGLKKLQPKIEALRERFGNDKQKLSQATLELYRKEKVNPMSGCLPIIIQIPVFIALYWVLVESVELRQAPFILWIHDLTTKDPYYLLPLLMGLSMFLQQRLNPPPPDPIQAKVLMFMPVLFTVMFLNFPAGLMLYWFVNNLLSFAQQWYIMRGLGKAEKSKK